ncbi:hypothetical protein [Caballeronia sp. LZ035]|uniref:hypothetical protein n=1 Tax=Caballeronia sp. LZ035 TaxID=3038568 RepID=UPI0028601D42|nr:hypothetical protein [Caballeronia sp. LZ035]MDR5761359.1 hypothetical protein [Caballeronia sp. LZ035]
MAVNVLLPMAAYQPRFAARRRALHAARIDIAAVCLASHSALALPPLPSAQRRDGLRRVLSIVVLATRPASCRRKRGRALAISICEHFSDHLEWLSPINHESLHEGRYLDGCRMGAVREWFD